MAAVGIGPRAVTSAQTEMAVTGLRKDTSARMGTVGIGLLVGGMFPRTVAEATGPERVTSAPTGTAVTGPPEDMSARTAAEATGVLATRRGAVADYPSWESK